MDKNTIQQIFSEQQIYFDSGNTKDIRNRINALKKLDQILIDHENEILLALKADLNKTNFEAYAAEYSICRLEIKLFLKKIHSWAKRQWVMPNQLTFPAQSYIYKEPYGNILNIAPWNYPFLLAIIPLIGAIGAGNTCVVKPSEISKNTSKLLKKMLNENFERGLIHVIEGDATTVGHLLDLPWNYVFFTGSPKVGSIVYQKAAKNLIPVTLELGGKSPCVITPSANLEVAAKRIIWGKFSNAGQTCVAPDYLVIHQSIKNQFVDLLHKTLKTFYGENPKESPDFGRIISTNHWERLVKIALEAKNDLSPHLFDKEKLYIAPLLFENCDIDSNLMQDEIFGPLLPCLTYNDEPSLHKILNKNPKPLAFYIFSTENDTSNNLIQKYAFGGGCINDVLMHLANHNLPFGGIGMSGMGNYQGKNSFDTFTHHKGILKQSSWIDFVFKYPPYNKFKMWLLKLLTR